MRGLRFGLVCAVVGAALTTMAFGAGSATAATVVCETSTPTCSSPFPTLSKFEVVGAVNFKGFPGGVVNCGLEWEFEIGLNSRPVVQAKVQRWKFINCTPSGHTAKMLSPPWPLWLTTTARPNGIGEIEPWISQPFEIDGCVYEQPLLPLEIEGGGWITDSGVVLSRVSGLCSAPATLTMSITSSKPIPMLWMEN